MCGDVETCRKALSVVLKRCMMMTKKDIFSVEDVAKAIDHAVLKPQYVSRDIEEQAAMCMTRGVGCICVRPTDVGLAVRCVSGSTVAVASVVGFPHGSHGLVLYTL